MAEGDPGLLDNLWGDWREWWKPTSVPAGAAYGPEDLGSARAETLGALGGRLLALSQGGLHPAQRAAILGSIGEVPQVYQQALGAGVEARMHAAALHKTEAELAQEASSNALFDKLIAAKTAGGSPGPSGPSGNLPAGGAIQTALAALAPAESGGNAGAQNAQGYSGRYQIGSSLAADSGVYKPAPGESVADDRGRATNQWRGTWVLPGMEPMSHEQFRANPQAQQAAAEAAMQHNWSQIQAAGLDKYVGKEVGGVNITAAGLLQGAWLGGIKGLQTWLSGGGDPADSNKTTVSKWASLQPPGGARTMTDAGGGGDSEAPGGAPFTPPTKPKSVADLTPEQLILLRQMPAAQRPAKILELTTKADTPILLSPAQSAHLGPGTWQWSPTAGYSRLAEGQATDLGADEKARLGMAPDAVVQRKGDGTYNVVDAGKTTFANPDYLKAHGFPSDAQVTVKPDGTPTVISAGQHRWATPEEIQRAGLPPDAKLSIAPNGQPTVIDKGTAPDAPLTPETARGVLIRYGDQVKAGTLDPNSIEGRRYIAAHQLLSQGTAVTVELPNGQKVRRMVPVETGYPPLGTPAAPPADIVTEQAKPLSESQAKTAVFLGNMEDAENRIRAVTGKGYDPGNTRDNYGQIAPGKNITISPEGRLYRQAQIIWYRNKLRWESGASIQDKEAFEEAAAYFPRPGDDAAAIAQKDALRQTSMLNMQIAAGRGTPGQPAATAPEQQQGAVRISPTQVRYVKDLVKAGKTSKAAAIELLKRGGLGPEWLED